MIGVSDEWDNDIYIYGVYHNNKDIFFYGISGKNDGYLVAFKQKDIRIVDRITTYDMVYFGNDGNSYFMMLHWALAENNLLDRILERDEDALELFSKLRWVDHKV